MLSRESLEFDSKPINNIPEIADDDEIKYEDLNKAELVQKVPNENKFKHIMKKTAVSKIIHTITKQPVPLS